MFSFDNQPHLNMLNSRGLENVRAMAEWKRQSSGMRTISADMQPIASVGIVGAGVMGAEIAAAYIKHNLPVIVTDANPEALATVARRTAIELAAQAGSGDGCEMVDRLLRPTVDLARAAKCDLVIESIIEKLSAKQEFYSRLQKHLSPQVIVASNTSTIPIGKLADGVPLPERFCGLHFFHPVRERPLVEIVRGKKTGPKTIAALVAHSKTIGKLPIVVADGPGFLVNRLLLPYLSEALQLLTEGVSIGQIESAATEFGMAKGPFGLMDEIGLDTTLHAGWSMAAAYPERITASPLLVAMIKSGRLGQKTGAGFFSYNETVSAKGTVPSAAADRDSPQPDPAAIEIIARWVKPSSNSSAEDIILRLIRPMISEAARILQDGKVTDPRDIDLGAIFGLGFPKRRGGLLWWANAVKPAMPAIVLGLPESIGLPLPSTPVLWDLPAQGDSYTSGISP